MATTGQDSRLDPLVIMAVRQNGVGILRAALPGLKPHLDEPCVGRDTLLTLAARHGSTECVRLLLSEGSSVDAPCAPPSATALYVATQEGLPQVVRVLLDAKADVTDTVGDGLTPLSVAVHQGGKSHAECARLLLSASQQAAIGAKKLDDCDEHGVNLLLKASYMGHDEIVKHLLKAGASVHHTDASGASALIVACRNGHAKCVQLLLKAGSGVDVAIADGGGTALHFAAKAGSADCVKQLLSAKANPTYASQSTGTTPLHIACQVGSLDCARLLLEGRANVQTADKDGVPPLFLAESQGHKAVAKLLLKQGADRASHKFVGDSEPSDDLIGAIASKLGFGS